MPGPHEIPSTLVNKSDSDDWDKDRENKITQDSFETNKNP